MNKEIITRVLSVAKKERYHILRDPYALTIAIVVPLFIVLVFGFVIDFDVKNIPISFQDQDQTAKSRDLLTKLENSGYFKIHQKLYSVDEAFKDIENGNSKASNMIDPVLCFGAKICPYPNTTAAYINMKPPTINTGCGLYFL